MGSAAVQGMLWGGSARDWAELQEPTGRPIWRDVLAQLAVGAGAEVLDAGCGAGGACVEALAMGFRPTGVDASAPLLQIARSRMPGVRFEEADLEKLPFEDARFDAVIAINSVMYAADMDAATRELGRVVKPRGRVALASWGAAEKCEMRDIFAAVVGTLPQRPPGGGPFALSAPGALSGVLEKAGLRPIRTGETAAPFEYPDLATFWRANASAGPLQGAMRAVGEAKVRAAVEEAVKKYTAADGSVKLRNAFVWAIGERA